MDERLFTVTYQSKYLCSISEVTDLENCPLDFLTRDEVDELVGGSSSWGWARCVLNSEVDKDISAIITEMKQRGQTRVKLNDDLATALSSTNYEKESPASGWYRIGKMLHLGVRPIKPKTPIQLFDLLFGQMHYIATKNLSPVVFNLTYVALCRSKGLTFMKRLVKWEEIDLAKLGIVHPEEVAFIHKMWDDPSKCPENKKKKMD